MLAKKHAFCSVLFRFPLKSNANSIEMATKLLIAFRVNISAAYQHHILNIVYTLSISLLARQGIPISSSFMYLIQPLLATFGKLMLMFEMRMC